MKSETGQPVTRDDVQFPNVLVELWGPGATGRAFTNAKSEFTFVTDIYGTTSIVAIADFPLGGGTTKTFSIGSKLTQLFHGETNTFENLDIFVDVHQFRGSVFFAQRDGTSIPIESGATEWNTEHTEMSSISEQDAKSTEVSFFLSFFLANDLENPLARSTFATFPEAGSALQFERFRLGRNTFNDGASES